MGSTGCSQSGRPPLAHPARSRRACLRGYLPFYRLIVNPQTTCGLTANNRVEPRGGDEFTVRFTDGTYTLEAGGPARSTAPSRLTWSPSCSWSLHDCPPPRPGL